eukprot:g22784.t1
MKQSKIADKDTSLPDALNVFSAWFEQNAGKVVIPCPDNPKHTYSLRHHFRSVFLGVNTRKATDLDGVRGRALRSCARQLADVFIDIFNLSLLQAKVASCFKKTTVIP